MEKRLWLSCDGKVMIGSQEVPRCRVLSIEPQHERRDVRVTFEVEVDELDIQFQARGLNKESGNPTDK